MGNFMTPHSRRTIRFTALARRIAFWLLLSIPSAQLSTALAQGTAFTYQGRLNDGANPAVGIYDLRFTIYDSVSGGSLVAGPLTNSSTAISNGLFTVALDFGSAPFNSALRWMEIGVRTNGGGAFVALTPRQQLTPTPYAIYAAGASATGLSGTIPSSSLGGTYGNAVTFNNGADSFDGTFTGQFFGSLFTGGLFTGTFLGSGSGLNDVWHTTGNSGTTPGANFLGTADSQPLELRVNNLRALRLEPATDINVGGFSPNVIGGHNDNFIVSGIGGSVIGGGGGTGLSNSIASTEGVIAGGYLNHIEAGNAIASTIGGGFDNDIASLSPRSVIAGGHGNRIGTNSLGSAIGGGEYNQVREGTDGGTYWSAVGGGYANIIRDASWFSFIGGGESNLMQGIADHSTISGGWNNTINGSFFLYVNETIGGGASNTIEGETVASTIGGGYDNRVFTNAQFGTIGGGALNSVSNLYATVPGGYLNSALGIFSFAAGRQARATNDGAFVWADSTPADFFSSASDQFLVRAAGGLYFSHGPAGVNIDQFNFNNGSIAYGLKFGTGSGEGIGSKRTGGGNQYGLDFYTQFNPRMSITQNGNVGIGTNNPSATLHVNGPASNSVALKISNGGISVAGAGIGTPTPAFVHRADGSNIDPTGLHRTTISNPLCDGDPNAILIVTHNYNPSLSGGYSETHPFGVYYNTLLSKWQIYHEDIAPMTTNNAYNVLIIKP
jgi:hypothetical protein